MGSSLTAGRLCGRQAALFPTRLSGLHAVRVVVNDDGLGFLRHVPDSGEVACTASMNTGGARSLAESYWAADVC
jgi:hypothetical protein